MSTTLATRSFDARTLGDFVAARREPAWLAEARRAAWKVFEELPWPASNMEEWRRTDIRAFRLDRFAPPSADARSPAIELPPALLTQGVELAGRSVSANSTPVSAELDAACAKKGVLFGSLDAIVREHGDLLRPHFARRVVDPHQDRFAALHEAYWSGGSVLYVPRGVVVEKPLHALFALTSGGSDVARQLVVLEEGAEATLLTESAGGGSGALHCGRVEIVLGPGARLRYVNLQDWDSTVWHFAHHNAVLDRDAKLQWTIAALGSRLAKVNQHVTLSGPGAEVQVNGVVFGEGRQHLSYHTLQHHEAGHCKSDLLYKGALQDHARLVWRGMIRVNPGADKTDGYQRNDNLMLSDDARADSIPGLEIQAHDVRCTHGATTGRVDDEQVFYARCRGLTRNEAVRMIVAGFFQQVFDRITIEGVREALGRAIGKRIRNYE